MAIVGVTRLHCKPWLCGIHFVLSWRILFACLFILGLVRCAAHNDHVARGPERPHAPQLDNYTWRDASGGIDSIANLAEPIVEAASFCRTAEAAAQAAALLASHIAEGAAAMRLAAAHLREQHASLVERASYAASQMVEQSALGATVSVTSAAAQLFEQQAAFKATVGDTISRLVEQHEQMKQSASEAAAHLADKLSHHSMLPRLHAQHAAMQQVASQAIMRMRDAALETAMRFADQLADGWGTGPAGLFQAANQAVEQMSEQPQVVLQHAMASVAAQLSEHHVALAEVASSASFKLARGAADGHEAFRQATEFAAVNVAGFLREHEAKMRQYASFIAAFADLQSTLSPTASRVASQLHEFQRHLHEAALASGSEESSADFCAAEAGHISLLESSQKQRALGLRWLLVLKAHLLEFRLHVYTACLFFAIALYFAILVVVTVARDGGESPASLSYGSFMQRAACWFLHRVFLGVTLLLLVDLMDAPPLNIRKYDAMGWPMWSTLLPLSTQLWFFIPAAALLNTAVARRDRDWYSAPASRRFFASLSREVHAAIVGCFVSDWFLFPTDLIFFGHHLLGLAIICGVWSLVLKEARLLQTATYGTATSGTIRFWWVTGISVASMEASSFLFNLYSVMSFGAVLNLSLFAVFTYSNMLSVMCVLAQHPWGTSIRAIWAAGGHIGEAIERQLARPLPKPCGWPLPKAWASASYVWKSVLVVTICLARHMQMWEYVRKEASTFSVIIVGMASIASAAGSAWRLRDFESSSVNERIQ